MESLKRLKSGEWRVKNLHIQLWKNLFNIHFDTSQLFNKVNKRLSEYANKQFNKTEVCEISPKSLLIRLIRLLAYLPIRLQKAFTLAEVLITLSIIGVVAALTMPTLVQNYKKKEATSRLKKFYSMMSQATLMIEQEQGTNSREWSGSGKIYQADETQNMNDDAYDFWNKYYAKYIKTVKVEKGIYDEENATNQGTKIYFADGSTATILVEGRATEFLFDINGNRSPNEMGRDQFDFLLANSRTVNDHELAANQSFNVGWLPHLNTREKALDYCNYNATYCTTLLFYDNFEFKDDYPYKL